MKLQLLLIGLFLAVTQSNAIASQNENQSDSQAGIAFFESKIRPILVEHCYKCHSAETASEGELQLDSRAATRKGGERGPAVVPGDAAGSWLLKAMTHADSDLKMPPKRDRLPDSVLADLKKWIEMGAPDPRVSDPVAGKKSWNKAGRDFWAYQPPLASEPPKVTDAIWPKGSIDHFILAQLEKSELHPSPDASPQVLLRRLRFDLVGLPPSPEDLTRFLSRMNADGIDSALASEVDELLASKQFGERWGRHWLDVARFGESSGTEANISFPYAWRYRDYVIDCINDDIPFNRFLFEQLAGDLLPVDNNAERARLLIATGFLAIGPKNLDAVDPRQFHADVIDEQIDTVTLAILGNSVACARCHDHKFDPFSMEDYYALAGIFESTKTFFGTAVSPANRIGGDPLRLPYVEQQKILHASIPMKRVEQLKEQLAKLRAEKAEMDEALKSMFSGEKPAKTFSLQDALRVFWQSGGIEGELEKVSDSGEALPLTMGVLEADKVVNAALLERGDINKPGTVVQRGFPQSLPLDDQLNIPIDHSGRLELAQWLTNPKHPLTGRVIVNRIWHHMFGAGIVTTVDNFGSTGKLPTHPELLDTLAVQFMQNGWSIKQLVREIALSRTYRQSSDFREDSFNRDPDNQLLWRFSKRRMEAESIRDAMLATSGELDLDRPVGSLVGRVIGDKPISLIGLDKRLPPDLDGFLNRSVYLPVIRDRLPDILDLFDFAEPSFVTGKRETTNVPIQALYLLNSPFAQDRGKGLARRLMHESTDEQRIQMAFLLCFNRHPEELETKRSLLFLQAKKHAVDESSDAVPMELLNFCQALLCTAEFRNLD